MVVVNVNERTPPHMLIKKPPRTRLSAATGRRGDYEAAILLDTSVGMAWIRAEAFIITHYE